MLRSSTHRSINLAIIQHIGNYIYMPLRNLFDDTILTYYLNINIRTTIIYIKGLKLYMPLGSHFDGAILTCYLYVDIRITIIYIKGLERQNLLRAHSTITLFLLLFRFALHVQLLRGSSHKSEAERFNLFFAFLSVCPLDDTISFSLSCLATFFSNLVVILSCLAISLSTLTADKIFS